MISRQRLRGRGRFIAVRTAGREGRSGHVKVRAIANGLHVSRAGFALPKVRPAVVRNRLRRRLREILRPVLAEQPGYDLVVSVAPAGALLAFDQLRDAVLEALGRALSRAGGVAAENGGSSR